MPILTVVSIGDKVKSVRRRQAITQLELSKQSGVSHRTLVNIETGKVDPHLSTVRKLAAALDVPPSDLLED